MIEKRWAQVNGLLSFVEVEDGALSPGWRGGIRQLNTCRFCGLYDWAHDENGKHPSAPEGTPCHMQKK